MVTCISDNQNRTICWEDGSSLGTSLPNHFSPVSSNPARTDFFVDANTQVFLADDSWRRFLPFQTPPSFQTLMTWGNRDGLLQVDRSYFDNYQTARRTLGRIRTQLAEALGDLSLIDFRLRSTALTQTERQSLGQRFNHVQALIRQYQGYAQVIADQYSRRGLNEAGVISRWTDGIFDYRFREHNAGSSRAIAIAQNDNADRYRHEENAVLLRFNMTGINNSRGGYLMGTAVKFLAVEMAREVLADIPAQQGVQPEVLGLCGNNLIVRGINALDMERFRAQVEERMVNFLSDPHRVFPESIARECGRATLTTADLEPEAIRWLTTRNSEGRYPLHLLAIHHFIDVDLTSNRASGNIHQVVVQALEELSTAEAMVSERDPNTQPTSVSLDDSVTLRNAEGGTVEVAALGPQARTPLRFLRAVRGEGATLAEREALRVVDYRSQEITGADIVANLPLVHAEHTLPIRQAERLSTLVTRAHEQLSSPGASAEEARAAINELLAFIQNPTDPEGDNRYSVETASGRVRADLPQEGTSMEAALRLTQEGSLLDLRLEGVRREQLFPQYLEGQLAQRGYYVGMLELASYRAHNQAHPGGRADQYHAEVFGIIRQAYQAQGINVLIATQGGDEIYVAFPTQDREGNPIDQARIDQVNQHVSSEFDRMMQNLLHHTCRKAPQAGGTHAGIHLVQHRLANGREVTTRHLYVVANDAQGHRRVFVENSMFHDPEIAEGILESVHTAFPDDHAVTASDVVVVDGLNESLSLVGLGTVRQVEYQHPENPRVRILLPINQSPPEGYIAVRTPPGIRITPVVELPQGSRAEDVRGAMTHVSHMPEDLKHAGVDVPVTGELARALEELGGIRLAPQDDSFTRLDRLWNSPRGRIGLNFGLTTAVDVGLNLFLEGVVEGQTDRFTDWHSYVNPALGTFSGAVGSFTGESFARGYYAYRAGNLMVSAEGRRVLNPAVFDSAATGARRNLVRWGGAFGGVVFTEVLLNGPTGLSQVPSSAALMTAVSSGSEHALAGMRSVAKARDWAKTLRALRVGGPGAFVAQMVIEQVALHAVSFAMRHYYLRNLQNEKRADVAVAMDRLDSFLQGRTDLPPHRNRAEYTQELVQGVMNAGHEYETILYMNNSPEGGVLQRALQNASEAEEAWNHFRRHHTDSERDIDSWSEDGNHTFHRAPSIEGERRRLQQAYEESRVALENAQNAFSRAVVAYEQRYHRGVLPESMRYDYDWARTTIESAHEERLSHDLAEFRDQLDYFLVDRGTRLENNRRESDPVMVRN